MISETCCFVNVYGLGIAGRLMANSGKTARMVIVEAYSIWNSTTYTLTLTIPKLKAIFVNNYQLLEAGNKTKFLEELLKLLYFDYTITIPPLPHEKDKADVIIKVSHLEKPDIPEGYPQTLIALFKCITDARVLATVPIPEVIQELRISTLERENGAVKRKREEEERLRRLREEEERRRLAWLAIPKRKRGMIYAKAIRNCGKLVTTAFLT